MTFIEIALTSLAYGFLFGYLIGIVRYSESTKNFTSLLDWR
jgi:hypothetical protein